MARMIRPGPGPYQPNDGAQIAGTIIGGLAAGGQNFMDAYDRQKQESLARARQRAAAEWEQRKFAEEQKGRRDVAEIAANSRTGAAKIGAGASMYGTKVRHSDAVAAIEDARTRHEAELIVRQAEGMSRSSGGQTVVTPETWRAMSPEQRRVAMAASEQDAAKRARENFSRDLAGKAARAHGRDAATLGAARIAAQGKGVDDAFLDGEKHLQNAATDADAVSFKARNPDVDAFYRVNSNLLRRAREEQLGKGGLTTDTAKAIADASAETVRRANPNLPEEKLAARIAAVHAELDARFGSAAQ